MVTELCLTGRRYSSYLEWMTEWLLRGRPRRKDQALGHSIHHVHATLPGP